MIYRVLLAVLLLSILSSCNKEEEEAKAEVPIEFEFEESLVEIDVLEGVSNNEILHKFNIIHNRIGFSEFKYSILNPSVEGALRLNSGLNLVSLAIEDCSKIDFELNSKITGKILIVDEVNSISDTVDFTINIVDAQEFNSPSIITPLGNEIEKPISLAMDSFGDIYINTPFEIRKMSQIGISSAYISIGLYNIYFDFDSSNNLYYVQHETGSLFKITPEKEKIILAQDSRLINAYYLVVNKETGNIYVTNDSKNIILEITEEGEVSTLAGEDEGYLDGEGAEAQFSDPGEISIDSFGNLYVVDQDSNINIEDRIRKITQEGIVTTPFSSPSEEIIPFKHIVRDMKIDDSDNIFLMTDEEVFEFFKNGEVQLLKGIGNKCDEENLTDVFSEEIGEVDSFSSLFLFGMDIDTDGNIFVGQNYSTKVFKFEKEN